jgi:hypothetical protein
MKMKRNMVQTLAVWVVLLGASAFAQTNGGYQVVPSGSDIKVRTDTAIPAKPAQGASFAATVSDDVMGSGGAVVIPRGSRATLVAVPSDDGKDTVLDLRAVRVNGARFNLTTNATSQSTAPGGLGANTRTAKYVGGGAALGAILGGIFGGGKGAAIGALAGAGAGAGGQVYMGRKKAIPAETQLSFKLAQDLEMRPAGTRRPGRPALQKR